MGQSVWTNPVNPPPTVNVMSVKRNQGFIRNTIFLFVRRRRQNARDGGNFLRRVEGVDRNIGNRGALVQPDGFENASQFVGTEDEINLRDFLSDICPVAFGEAPRDDELLAVPVAFHLRHLEDRVDRFLFGGIDEAAGIDDENVGFLFVESDGVSLPGERSQHHFAVDEIFGASKADKADAGRLPIVFSHADYCSRATTDLADQEVTFRNANSPS